VILELLTLAALLRIDASGDVYGAGDLSPPTATIYSSLASFDLIEVELLEAETLSLRVRLAGIPDPGMLPNGLTLPVIDVYLDLADGGAETLLPGPRMAMPLGTGWEVAVRVHGDDAYAILSEDDDPRPYPVRVTRRGDTLFLDTSLAAPEQVRDVHALTGVYDPFSGDGWRPLTLQPSPWAFSSAAPAAPVIDLLAPDDESQRLAIARATLPSWPTSNASSLWLVAMYAGLAIAVIGLWLRFTTSKPAEAGGAGGEVDLLGDEELRYEPVEDEQAGAAPARSQPTGRGS